MKHDIITPRGTVEVQEWRCATGINDLSGKYETDKVIFEASSAFAGEIVLKTSVRPGESTHVALAALSTLLDGSYKNRKTKKIEDSETTEDHSTGRRSNPQNIPYEALLQYIASKNTEVITDEFLSVNPEPLTVAS